MGRGRGGIAATKLRKTYTYRPPPPSVFQHDSTDLKQVRNVLVHAW